MPTSPVTVAVTRPLPGAALAALPAGAVVRTWPGSTPPDPSELRELCDDADAILAFSGDPIDADLVAHLSDRLRVVAVVTAGIDGLDVDALASAGVVVTSSRGVLEETTAELAVTLLLTVFRRVTVADRWVRSGAWVEPAPRELFGRDAHGSTLGLVGFGRIARAVAQRATALGMDVQHHDRSRTTHPGSRWVTLPDLLETSDAVSLHVPLTPETTCLIGRGELARMRSDAVLVNTARGGVVDTDALVDALREGRIGGAGLDVTDPEPLPTDHPLLAMDTCVVLPHVGSATPATRDAMVAQAVANVTAVLDGEPPLTPLTD